MFKKIMLCWVIVIAAAAAKAADNQLVEPDLFKSDIEQHGSFNAEDLRNSPLLRAMFGLSVNEVNSDLLRICLVQQNSCRVVKRDAKVNLVANNGQVKFDDTIN